MMTKRFLRSAPHLPVKNLQATFDYYMNTLGFTAHWAFGGKDGGVSRDEMRLLFAEEPQFAEGINSQAHRLPLVWFVENIDEIYKEFQSRRVLISDPLQLRPYGLWEFAFIDINGYYIRVAEQGDGRRDL
ncbi:MAG TPA: VOC family protein [Flavisolibacter sp.]|nr:VOC family protein [Flavisolibacter sp.]